MERHPRERKVGVLSAFDRPQSVCLAALCGTVLGFVLSACYLSAGHEPSASAHSDPRRYPLTGVVKSIDTHARTATVAHDKVGDYMPAMTMTYKIKDDKGFASMHEGDQIKATLVVTDSGEMWLESVVVTSTQKKQ